jgi:hypothetical protein
VAVALLVASGAAVAAGVTAAPSSSASLSPSTSTATANATIDDVARVLAGLPPAPGSPLGTVAATKPVLAHARVIGEAWSRRTAPTLAALQAFTAAELVDAGDGPVFYPFGGPDILNAVALVPQATTYTLLGLEPVGPLPTAELFTDPRVLPGVQRALAFVLRNNHFITDAMNAQLKGRVGVAALVSFFLVRTGHTIVEARLVTLGPDGRVVEAGPDTTAPAAVQGVEFVVQRSGSERPQRVRYFAGNINDEFFSRTPGLVPHLLAQGRLTTVLKAASYLMYYPAFDDIRALVLARSGMIVTDTSGLPFHRLDTAPWQLTLFGSYKAPIAAYADRCQPDLQAALQKRGRGKLAFVYGYAYPGHNHLVVARRAADRAIETPVFDGTKYRGENTLCVDGRVRIEHPG